MTWTVYNCTGLDLLDYRFRRLLISQGSVHATRSRGGEFLVIAHLHFAHFEIKIGQWRYY